MGGKVPEIEIYYSNPPTSGGISIRRKISHPVWGSAWLERRIDSDNGLLGSSEAAVYLGITLIWLYQLIRQKKLHPRRKQGRLVFKFGALRSYKKKRQKRRSQGHKKAEEAWLIN